MTTRFAIPSTIKAITNIAIVLCLISFLGMGCAGSGLGKPIAKKGPDGIVYAVNAQDALELAQWAVTQVLPDQKIMRLKKPRLGLLVHEVNQPGHYKVARFKETDYFYEIDLFQSEGSTPQGGTVTGYTYTVKGNGDLKNGPGNVAQIHQRLDEAFGQTGRGVPVTGVQAVAPRPPKISATQAPPTAPAPTAAPPAALSPTVVAPEKPMVKEAPSEAEVVPMDRGKKLSTDEDAFVKLKKLKELLDQGIITEEEFQMKKKELLDRI